MTQVEDIRQLSEEVAKLRERIAVLESSSARVAYIYPVLQPQYPVYSPYPGWPTVTCTSGDSFFDAAGAALS